MYSHIYCKEANLAVVIDHFLLWWDIILAYDINKYIYEKYVIVYLAFTSVMCEKFFFVLLMYMERVIMDCESRIYHKNAFTIDKNLRTTKIYTK